MVMVPKFHDVQLIGLNERAKKIIKYYHNCLKLQEYDELGRPLNMYKGKQAIFCVAPDAFWNGWFILDEDVRFEAEYQYFTEVLKEMGMIDEDDSETL